MRFSQRVFEPGELSAHVCYDLRLFGVAVVAKGIELACVVTNCCGEDRAANSIL
jgi:hypothetical protein